MSGVYIAKCYAKRMWASGNSVQEVVLKLNKSLEFADLVDVWHFPTESEGSVSVDSEFHFVFSGGRVGVPRQNINRARTVDFWLRETESRGK